MKTFCPSFFLAIYLLLSWQCTQAPRQNDIHLSAADSIYTENYIIKIHLTEPQRALQLLDKAVEKKIMSDFKADYFRSVIYSGMRMFHIEENYLEKVLQNDSMKQMSLNFYLNINSRIIESYISSSKYEQALHIANEIIQKAQAGNNIQTKCRMLLALGRIYEQQHSKDLSDQYYAQAAQLLENSPNIGDLAMLSYIYGIQMKVYYIRKEYEKAIQTGKKRELLIDRMKKLEGAPDGYIDEQYGFLYSKMAGFYLENKQPEKADEAFKLYQSTLFSQAERGKEEAVPYLILAGRYKEAESLMRKLESYDNDTINVDFQTYLNNKSEIASRSGDYRAAFQYKERYIAIQDSIYARDKRDAALELATIYETNQKNLQIKEQKAQSDRQKIIIFFSLGILFLTLLALYLLGRHLHATKQKNRFLARQIDSQLAYREELKKANAELELLKQHQDDSVREELPETVTMEENDIQTTNLNKKLFDELERLVDEKKLYLDPDISRDQLLKQIRISKNTFAQLIQTYNGTNFTGYINNKRLEHSIHLLKNFQAYTIEAVAMDSGFNNVRSFYRIFRDKYGMTPSEYRSALKKE